MLTKKEPRITFIAPIYNYLPVITSSLIAQKYDNWQLVLIHDGPTTELRLKLHVASYNDDRIQYLETKKRLQHYGHPYRQWALQELKENKLVPDTDYVVITNADNYHMPVYCSRMVAGFRDPATVATYCSHMVHSYKNWEVIPCRMERGFVDSAGVMVKREVACEIGWNNVKDHSSDWLYFQEIMKKYGRQSFKSINGCLISHN